MNVLLSIKPRYAEFIINGNKKYEFRKTIFKRNDINKVYIYSTSPIKKIVGSFVIGNIIEEHPVQLWNIYGLYSGLSDIEFSKYFNGNTKGFAIEIKKLEKFNTPIDPREVFPDFVPPQSFCYVDMPLEIGEK